jgi:hypothetical protein
MAHLGKSWPLHFRRDLGLQITNNNRSWPQAYTVRWQQTFGTVGQHMAEKTWLIPVDFEVPSGRMFYRTPFQTVGPKSVRVEVDLGISGNPQNYSGTLRVLDSTGAQLYKQLLTRGLSSDYGGFSPNQPPPVCEVDGTFFVRNAFFAGGTAGLTFVGW